MSWQIGHGGFLRNVRGCAVLLILFCSFALGQSGKSSSRLASYKGLQLGFSTEEIAKAIGARFGPCKPIHSADFDYGNVCVQLSPSSPVLQEFFVDSSAMQHLGLYEKWGATSLWTRFADGRLVQLGVSFADINRSGERIVLQRTETGIKQFPEIVPIPLYISPEAFIEGLQREYGTPQGNDATIVGRFYVLSRAFRNAPTLMHTPIGGSHAPGRNYRAATWDDGAVEILFAGQQDLKYRFDEKKHRTTDCCEVDTGSYFLLLQDKSAVRLLAQLGQQEESAIQSKRQKADAAIRRQQRDADEQRAHQLEKQKKSVNPF